jgi:diguanylate cyclase (GGDEF)-like protein
MKISVKLISERFLFLFIMLLGTFLASYFYVIPHIEQIETKEGVKDISSVKLRIDKDLDVLRLLATDWGEWDDTYMYISDRNKAYEKSNLTDKVLADLEIDFIFIVKENGEVAWKQFSEKIIKFGTAELWQQNNWNSDHPFIALMSNQKKGLIYSNFGTVLVAGSKIVPSQGEGDSRGYLYFGKLLTEDFVKKISQDLGYPIEFSIDNHRGNSGVHFSSQNKKIIHGSIVFANTDAHFISISIVQPRPFYQEALMAIKFNLLVISGLVIFSSVITFIILKKVLVNPIKQLRRQTYHFSRDQSSIPIKILNSNDELGQLSVSLVNMANELKRIWRLQEQEKNEYLEASNTDELTQLGNRRCMETYLNNQTWSAPKYWAFLMIDLDHFKQINDKWGHDTGDIVLQQFSSLLTAVCRGSDIIFRTGGEEFVVVCERTNHERGCLIVERIRKAIEIFEFGPAGNGFNITCSIGFYTMFNNKPNVDWKSKIKIADFAMYAAKNSGRNTWVGLAINKQHPLFDKYKLPIDPGLLVEDIKSEKLLVFSQNQKPEDLHWQ